MPRKKREANGQLVIKRYGNRRLYNTETRSYVNYQDLIKLARTGCDFQVVDSTTKEDVTKAILIQLILEEEKNSRNILPTQFLFQLLRANEESLQDFFKNHLTASLTAYIKTKEEFDKRFRSVLEMAIPTPETWEKLIPGADLMRGFLGGGKKDEHDK
jgi:polyhydroxyalkanoate synthesis repressor PhaR